MHTGKVIRLAVLALLVACSSPPAQKGLAGGFAKPAEHADDPTCPVLVSGTSVTVEDTDAGAAFVFVTTGDVADVRKRAAALVEMHNAHHANMGSDGAAHEMKHQMGTMISAHSTAEVAEIEGGVRVVFTAHDPAAIQSELRMHAQHLAGGSCEM